MTQQGARTNARKPKPVPEGDAELSLSQWLATRGLTGEKRMEVGGHWFRFVRSATPAQLAAFHEANNKGDLVGMMSAFLVDPGERDELDRALDSQTQPIDVKQSGEFLKAIVNFLVAGDVGESSAS